MLDLEMVTSRNGARVEFHFETEKAREDLLSGTLSQKKLQSRVRGQIHIEGADTGKGTVIHLLMNKDLVGEVMNEAKYTIWQSQKDKDWRHRRHATSSVEELGLIPAILTKILFNENEGPSMFTIGVPRDEDENEFVGPTVQEMVDIISDEKDSDRLLKMQSLNFANKCKFCPMPTGTCPNRNASFDYESVKKALQEDQPPAQ